jgi:hypothetical protein
MLKKLSAEKADTPKKPRPPSSELYIENQKLQREQKRISRRARNSNSGDGIEFVRCRICGDHRAVLNVRYLSKHGSEMNGRCLR